MRFLINPGASSRRRRRAGKVRVNPVTLDTVRRRRKVRSVSSRSASGPARSRQTILKVKPMAKRARKRGKGGRFLKAGTAPRRRRRRAAVARTVTAPRRRRRRRSVAVARRRRTVSAAAPRRRRRRAGFRRNPPLAVRGIINGVVDGLKTGTAVVAGQTLARKVRGAVQGMLPASVNVSSGIGQVGVTLAAAVGTSIATRFLPANLRKYAPFIVAGAFSETINAALAQTPIAPYLSAFPSRRVVRVGPGAPARNGRGVSAWPQALPAGRMAAYPQMRTAGMSTVGA